MTIERILHRMNDDMLMLTGSGVAEVRLPRKLFLRVLYELTALDGPPFIPPRHRQATSLPTMLVLNAPGGASFRVALAEAEAA